MMIFVTLFGVICLAIKVFIHYFGSKHSKSKKIGDSITSSPEIPTTPEDQTSMATTASMKTRGSLRMSHKDRKAKPMPVSLYQMKQKQSPGSSGSKNRQHKAAMKAIARAAKSEPNKNLSRDNSRQANDNSDENIANDNDSPTNLSNISQTDADDINRDLETVIQARMAHDVATAGRSNDDADAGHSKHNSNQPEVHIVQIRDMDEGVQHSQPTWPQTESDI